MSTTNRENDYLDELIEESKADSVTFAKLWEGQELSLEMRSRRKQLGITQSDVAKRLNWSTPRVCELERNPASVSMKRLMAYLSAIEATLEFRPLAGAGGSKKGAKKQVA